MKTEGTEVSKSIDFSYPTSPNAVRFGFAKTGCWTLSLNFDHSTKSISPEALSGHAEREEALAAGRARQEPWSRIFVKFHPDEAAAPQQAGAAN